MYPCASLARSWGHSPEGQCGHGDLLYRASPTVIAALRDCVAVSAGFDHALAAVADGAAFSWGDGQDGVLGLGLEFAHDDNGNVRAPARIAALARRCVVNVSAGRCHSLALDARGGVWGFGDKLVALFFDPPKEKRRREALLASLCFSLSLSHRLCGRKSAERRGGAPHPHSSRARSSSNAQAAACCARARADEEETTTVCWEPRRVRGLSGRVVVDVAACVSRLPEPPPCLALLVCADGACVGVRTGSVSPVGLGAQARFAYVSPDGEGSPTPHTHTAPRVRALFFEHVFLRRYCCFSLSDEITSQYRRYVVTNCGSVWVLDGRQHPHRLAGLSEGERATAVSALARTTRLLVDTERGAVVELDSSTALARPRRRYISRSIGNSSARTRHIAQVPRVSTLEIIDEASSSPCLTQIVEHR